MYIKRHIKNAMDVAATMYPSVIVTGARQVGKTTLLRQELDKMEFVSLDDLQVLSMAKENPSLFFNIYKPPLIIDEVQYEPKLFHYIKLIGDETKKKSQFFMTGSQSFSLMKNASESLAGRVGILQLLGLSYREIKNIPIYSPFLPTNEHIQQMSDHPTPLDYWEIMDIIHKGSYPAIYEGAYDNEKRARFFSDYLKSYLERDIRMIGNISDESAFLRFITVVASLTSQQLNYTTIARAVGKEVNTIKRWLSILESSGIVYLLYPYYENISKRLSKTPKLYFLDTGLASYLCGWESSKQLANGAMCGAMFETFVIAEIIKSYYNFGIDTKMTLSYYRENNQKEIDLLIQNNGTLYPIEIKMTASPNISHIKHFAALKESKNKIGQGGLICMYNKPLYLNETNRIIPITMI